MNRKWVFALSLIAVLVISACSGSGASSGGTGTPADGAKAYFNAALGGQGDPMTLVCSSLPADQKKQMTDAFAAMKSTYAQVNASLDLSGLTFTTQNQNGDTAEVVVAGTMKVTANNSTQDVPFPSQTINMKNESGWKVCG